MTHRPLIAVTALSAALAGCGIAPLDAQWKDPASAPESLRGSTVLVVCEADEQVVKQMCQDKVAAELRTLGANTALLPNNLDGTPGRLSDEARAVKARAIFNTKVTPDVPRYGSSSGVSVGIGMGGGFGGRGYGGIGVGVPIGGSGYRMSQGYVANASLSDVGSGRLLWTGKASARDSNDLGWQLDSLTKAVVGGVQQAGWL